MVIRCSLTAAMVPYPAASQAAILNRWASLSAALLLFKLVCGIGAATSTNITIDDSSDLIRYSNAPDGGEAWTHVPWDTHAYNNTVSFINASGASASFQFNGSAVYVYGSDWKFGRPFMPSIDGQQASSVSVVGNNPAHDLNYSCIWNIENLSPHEEHLLMITTLLSTSGFNSSNDDGAAFSLDQIVYTQVTGDDSTTGSSSAQPDTPAATSSSQNTAVTSPPLGAIVGGAVGGAALVTSGIAVAIYLFRKAGKASRMRQDILFSPLATVDHDMEMRGVDGRYSLDAGAASPPDASPRPFSSPETSAVDSESKRLPYSPNEKLSSITASSSDAVNRDSRYASTLDASSAGIAVRRSRSAQDSVSPIEEITELRSEVARLRSSGSRNVAGALRLANPLTEEALELEMAGVPPPDYDFPSQIHFTNDEK